MPDRDQLEDLETPAYVYDLAELDSSHRALRSALPAPSRLFYSLKANPHPAIVGRLAGLGCDAEVCSTGELAAALNAGVPPGRILCTGPGRRDHEVAEAVKAGVRWFSVDSPYGLEQVDRVAGAAGAQTRCLLRVNDRVPTPGQGLTMTGVASQFGADAEWIEREPDRFRSRPAAALAGFHLYMGSNLPDPAALLAQFRTAVATARRLGDVLGIEPELVDLGGGFGVPFARPGTRPDLSGLHDGITEILDAGFAGWRDRRPEIAFESGRFLAGTCGTLLTRVLDVKRSHGQPVVVLESGINHLGGMSGLRRLPPLVPHLRRTGPATGAAGARIDNAIVAGPLCTPLDTWARSAQLDEVRPGDVVEVPNVGAYGLSASLLAFLGHPAPREVVLAGGRVRDVSQLAIVRRVLQPPAPSRAGSGAEKEVPS